MRCPCTQWELPTAFPHAGGCHLHWAGGHLDRKQEAVAEHRQKAAAPFIPKEARRVNTTHHWGTALDSLQREPASGARLPVQTALRDAQELLLLYR